MCIYCCIVGIDSRPRIDALRSARRYMGEALRSGVVPYFICGANRSFAKKGPISTAKEPYLNGKRALFERQKSPLTRECVLLHISTAKEPYLNGKRALFPRQKSPISTAKEHYLNGKRALFPRQKRPTCTAKETYLHNKRDLSEQQKRPTYTTKETYLNSKRDLLTQQKSLAAWGRCLTLSAELDDTLPKRALFPRQKRPT